MPRATPRMPARRLAISACALGLGALLARAGISSTAWVAGPTVPRRAAAAAVFSTVAVLVPAGNARAQQVYAPSVNEDPNPGEKRLKDSPEVVKARWEARAKAKVRQQELKEEFRGYFAEFAADGAPMEKRLEMLKTMGDVIKREKMLPIGITRDDLVKGTNTVKFNLGCVRLEVKKGECKKLNKGIDKLFATLEKQQDLTIVGR
mmetsp:Transcript_72518/g.168010  ORF Transcript_72518/g.168010 Transcript_72518/m.168010 type:complete len:205 (-) Transcript_72518:79-693(-)